MERSLALLVLCACVGAVLATGAAVSGGEVPIHYTEQQPLALQHDEAAAAPAPAAAEQPRFAEAAAEAETETEAEAESETEAEAEAEGDDSEEGFEKPEVELPWKDDDAFTKEVAATSASLGRAEQAELKRVDTVIAESRNTMTQSAKCLMHCANGYGLCTRTNPGGCACAAGCMCNRGEADATCAEHCHPDNQMNFVYGYHDANHFSPHLWAKSIGDVMSDYSQVRACLAGCAKRGKCAPRFCPRHPSGGYKCSACKRLEVVPRPRPRKAGKTWRYYTTPRAQRNGHIHHRVTVQHAHNDVDAFGHVVRHAHTHTRSHTHYPADPSTRPRFHYPASLVEADAHVEADNENEAEADAEAESEADAEADSESESESEVDAEAVAEAHTELAAKAELDAMVEAAAEAEADAGYVQVTSTPYGTVYTADPSNIARVAPRVVREQFVEPFPGDDMADNGLVDARVPQDPLAKKIDCNFYDCTGMQSEPYVPVGSLNPVVPYRWAPEARTTTFSTVPDMLEPRAEQKYVVVA